VLELEEASSDAPREDAQEGEEDRPRRKRSRGGRGRRRKKPVDGTEEEPAVAAEGAEAPSASEESDEESTDEEGPRKRRRRGSRGGRKRRRKSDSDEEGEDTPTAAVFEVIPGEEDDLPELPELPDEAELIDDEGAPARGGRKKAARKKKASRKKARGRRSRDEEDEEGETTSRRRKEPEPVVPDRQILVNAIDPEETRVAVVRDGKILDFQMTVDSDQSLVNDIYRGRIVNIEASIGAAFVDFGRGRNGFLHTSDVLPTYADGEKEGKKGGGGKSLLEILTTGIDPEDWDASSSQPTVSEELVAEDEGADDAEDSEEGAEAKEGSKKGGRSKGRGRAKARQSRFRARPRTPISELFKVGQRVVVQITKDAIGDKGPTLTTYLSIPGRYLVLMPSISHRGVSRKIEDQKERKRLKRILDGMDIPEGMGVIARTASMGHKKEEIKRDLDYLLGAWNRLTKRLEQGRNPAPLYQESDVAIRTVRDLFGPETEAVIVDEPQALEEIREFAQLLMPEQVDRIKEHDGKRPLFHECGVEQDFEKIFTRRIDLPSGGSIVIDQAEALVAIDVNSGKTRTSSHDFEETALKTNLEAAPEIARQIRLRDLGGIIVLDFIDMSRSSHRKQVETAFRKCFEDDRARSKLGRISQFGLLEMTRQRLGPGMSKKLFRPCPACRGAGRVRTDSSRGAAIMRRLGSALTLKGFTRVEVRAHPGTIAHLREERADELKMLEQHSGRTIDLVEVPDQVEDSVLRYLRTDGREVRPGGRRKR
jgi:ribonuclease E